MDAHTQGFLLFAGIWFLSGLLNLALSKRTPEEWELYALTRPRAAAVVRFLRRVGLNLPAILRAANSWLAAKASSGKAGAQ